VECKLVGGNIWHLFLLYSEISNCVSMAQQAIPWDEPLMPAIQDVTPRSRAQSASRMGALLLPGNQNLKHTNFVDTAILNVLGGLPVSLNQPLKSSDD
jgi:hypothetical protein